MVVSSKITLNATEIMVDPSESTLFRETESLRPTKYIDEAEKLFTFTKKGVEHDQRIELINASYYKKGVVPRQEKIGSVFITKWYHAYTPARIIRLMAYTELRNRERSHRFIQKLLITIREVKEIPKMIRIIRSGLT